jgi:hypothetical protein
MATVLKNVSSSFRGSAAWAGFCRWGCRMDVRVFNGRREIMPGLAGQQGLLLAWGWLGARVLFRRGLEGVSKGLRWGLEGNQHFLHFEGA